MTTLKSIAVVLFFILYSCGQNSARHKLDPAAIELNDKAMLLVPFIDNSDSSRKAISLLDKATEIDSSYFLGYSNKLMFYYQLKEFDKALWTNNKLIQLRPNAHDLYMTSGILYEQLGDTSAANACFSKALAICNAVLDTMDSKNRDFIMLTMNQALNHIMLGDSIKGNSILVNLYNNLPDNAKFDNIEKKQIKELIGKSKMDLSWRRFNTDKYSH